VLVEARCGHHPEAVRVVHQLFTELEDRVVHGVPGAVEVVGDPADAAAVLADLTRHPAHGPGRHHVAGRTHLGVLLGEAGGLTARLPTPEPALAPAQPRGPTEARQVDQHHLVAILHLGDDATGGTADRRGVQLDHHLDGPAGLIDQPQDVHVGQAHEDLADAGRVGDHGGSPVGCVSPNRLTEPPFCLLRPSSTRTPRRCHPRASAKTHL